MKISSAAFENGEMIPIKYTCDGENISPPLRWEDIPSGTVSLTIICEDPDAPSKIWTHWLIFNIPPSLENLEEGIDTVHLLENGALQGLNDSGAIGYRGPCPPGGMHRYYFRLYALDIKLELEPVVSKEMLLKSMQGHILGTGELMGIYNH